MGKSEGNVDRRGASARVRQRPGVRVLAVRDAAGGAIVLIVDIGKLQGAEPGDRVRLARGGDLVGFADVTRVMKSNCVADFNVGAPGPAAPPRVGDSANVLDQFGAFKLRPPPLVKAVFKIDQRMFVTVAVDTTHGIERGHELKIMRGEVFVARFHVDQVLLGVAMGILTQENLGRVGLPRKGDRVDLP
jgi:hypothetical protein